MHNNANTSPAVSPFPFAKFLPGLVLGVVVGAFTAAFVTPIAHTWATLPPDPVSHGPRPEANAAIDAPESVAIGDASEGR